MSLTSGELASLVEELKPEIEGGRVSRIFQPSEDELLVKVRTGRETRFLLVSTRPSLMRFHVAFKPDRQEAPPPAFCMLLRKYLAGRRLQEVRAFPGERRVELKINEMKLIAELFGARGLIVLTDPSGKILGTNRWVRTKTRDLALGAIYAAPGKPSRAAEPAPRFTASGEPLSLNRLVDEFYAEKEASRLFELEVSNLEKVLKTGEDKLKKRLRKQRRELEKLEQYAAWGKRGDILKAHYHLLKKGMKEIELPDPFSAGPGKVKLPLDPSKSPEENLASCYGKAKKYKTGRKIVEDNIRAGLKELEGLRNLRKDLEAADAEEELQEVRNRLEAAGLLRRREKREYPGGRKGEVRARVFLSSEGKKIFVGKDARSNEELTFRLARGRDLWLHARGFAGSHVVVPLDRGESVTEELLLDAATLAFLFSKAGKDTAAEILYTYRKFVKRAKSGARGAVTISGEKTIFLRPEEKRIKRLKKGE